MTSVARAPSPAALFPVSGFWFLEARAENSWHCGICPRTQNLLV